MLFLRFCDPFCLNSGSEVWRVISGGQENLPQCQLRAASSDCSIFLMTACCVFRKLNMHTMEHVQG